MTLSSLTPIIMPIVVILVTYLFNQKAKRNQSILVPPKQNQLYDKILFGFTLLLNVLGISIPAILFYVNLSKVLHNPQSSDPVLVIVYAIETIATIVTFYWLDRELYRSIDFKNSKKYLIYLTFVIELDGEMTRVWAIKGNAEKVFSCVTSLDDFENHVYIPISFTEIERKQIKYTRIGDE